MIKNFISLLSSDLFNTLFHSLIGIKISKYKKGDTVSFIFSSQKEKGFVKSIHQNQNTDLKSVNNERFQYSLTYKNLLRNEKEIILFNEEQLNPCRIVLIEKINKQKLKRNFL